MVSNWSPPVHLLFTGRANEVPFYQHYHSTNTFDTCKGALPRKTPGIAGDNSRHCRRNTTPISIRASMLAVQPGQLVLSANLSLSPCLLSMQTLSSPFTALEHLGEGPRPQGQQPRREEKQRTHGPILTCWKHATNLGFHSPHSWNCWEF